MVNDNTIAAVPRSGRGKGASRVLRRQNRIPGVFYYGTDQNFAFAVNRIKLNQLLKQHHSLIRLEMEGETPRECVVREIQRDPVTDEVLHIDLLGIKRGQKLTVTVPIRLHGIPVGVKTSGGVLQHGLTEVEVECLPKDIPPALDVDVAHLKIGQSLHVEDLDFPTLRFLVGEKAILATVVAPVIPREAVEVVKAEEEKAPQEKEEEEKS